MSVSILTNPNPGSWCNLYARSWTATEYLNSQGLTTVKRDEITATDGMIIYNSDTNAFEGYINGSWQSLATTGEIPPAVPNSSFLCSNIGDVVLSTSDNLLFNTISYNNNNNLSNSPGYTAYTAPIDGTYSFSFSCQATNMDGDNLVVQLTNTNFSLLAPIVNIGAGSDTTAIYNASGTIFIQLTAGTEVHMITMMSGTGDITCTLNNMFFSGCLIKAD